MEHDAAGGRSTASGGAADSGRDDGRTAAGDVHHRQVAGRSSAGTAADRHGTGRARTVASGIVPLALVVALAAYVFGPGADMLDVGVPLPEITIERVDFVDSEIRATVRNTGPMPVSVAVADINDRIHPAAVEPDGHLERYETALVRIPFDWNPAEPYVVGITTDDGTRFEREVAAAAPALDASSEVLGLFAIIGTYVGVIPVMIGMLWLPFIRRMGQSVYVFFLAVTVGLLFFLALDSIEEAVSVSQESLAGSFNGLMLLATSATVSFLGLYYAGERLAGGSRASRGGNGHDVRDDGSSGNVAGLGTCSRPLSRPLAIALMISIGIGLHNFGEGLAIGAAVGLGSVAFSTFLIVGFALHNITEGVAIASPLTRARVRVWQLGLLGLAAGAPAILGGWMGVLAYSPLASVVFLGVGAGAIFQVMAVLLRWIARGDEGDDDDACRTDDTDYDKNDDPRACARDARRSQDARPAVRGAPLAAGIAAGMLIMYATSILV